MQFTGFLFVFSIVLFISFIRPLLIIKKPYDERQVAMSNQSYRYSMLTVWVLCLFFSFFYPLLDFQPYVIIQTIFFVSGAVHLSYRIIHHSLIPLGNTVISLIIATILTIVAISVHFITIVLEYTNKNQPISLQDWFSLSVLFLSFSSILISLIYRKHKDRLEDD